MTIHQFPHRKIHPGFGPYSPERNPLAPPQPRMLGAWIISGIAIAFLLIGVALVVAGM